MEELAHLKAYFDSLPDALIIFSLPGINTPSTLKLVWHNKACQDPPQFANDLCAHVLALQHDPNATFLHLDELKIGQRSYDAELSKISLAVGTYYSLRYRLLHASAQSNQVNVPFQNFFNQNVEPPLTQSIPMLQHVLTFDFTDTAFGPVESWSACLKSSIFTCLSLQWACCLCWTEQCCMIYNDAYSQIMASKHPAMLGQNAAIVWPELWSVLDPIAQNLFKTGQTVFAQNSTLFLETGDNSSLRETIVDWSYVPVMAEDGRVKGFLNMVLEHTEKNFLDRRNRVLQNLSFELREHLTAVEAFQRCKRNIESLSEDLPFALLYSVRRPLDDKGSPDLSSVELNLESTVGLEPSYPGLYNNLRFNFDQSTEHWTSSILCDWPIQQLFEDQVILRFIDVLPAHLQVTSNRVWGDTVRSAVLIALQGPENSLRAVFIIGLNTRAPWCEAYENFLLALAQVLDGALLGIRERENEDMERMMKANLQRAREAEAARKAQEYFVDVVHHEIRNPISAIVQAAELLEGNLKALSRLVRELSNTAQSAPSQIANALSKLLQNMTEEVREAQDTTVSVSLAARHQSIIAADILASSKLSQGLLNVCPISVQLRLEISNIVKLLSLQASASNIEIRTQYGKHIKSDTMLRLDPTRLAQIIMNLLSNSLRLLSHTDRTGPKFCAIQLDLERNEPDLSSSPYTLSSLLTSHRDTAYERSDDVFLSDTAYLVVSVYDNGPGMDAKTQNYLFTRFNSLDQIVQSTRKREGGSGLGTYLCRKLSQLQGGAISVNSEKGVGTAFTFYIKVEKGSKEQANIEWRPGAVSSITSADSERLTTLNSTNHAASKPHVLVVEDNHIAAKLLRRQLEKSGYRVTVATNGNEALIAFETIPDLAACFLDIELPIMDGKEVIQRVRSIEKTNKVAIPLPVCAITGNARPELLDEAWAAGVDKVLTKPYNIQEVLGWLRQSVRAQ